jgi:hypothetical protein
MVDCIRVPPHNQQLFNGLTDFHKYCTNNIPPGAIPALHFLIFYHQYRNKTAVQTSELIAPLNIC